jgi:hypothetical protein
MLRVEAETVPGQRPSDWLEVIVDREGDLVVSLLDFQGPLAPSDALAGALRGEAHEALEKHQPLHSVVGALELQLAARPGAELGMLVLRFSQRDAKIELLNAGMPAVACVGPGGQMVLRPALSDALGRRVGEVHPYELIPLAWGSTWLAVSDGALNGSLGRENVTGLCAKLGLTDRGLPLSSAGSAEQSKALQALLPATQLQGDDATLVLVSADPEIRFKHG